MPACIVIMDIKLQYMQSGIQFAYKIPILSSCYSDSCYSVIPIFPRLASHSDSCYICYSDISEISFPDCIISVFSVQRLIWFIAGVDIPNRGFVRKRQFRTQCETNVFQRRRRVEYQNVFAAIVQKRVQTTSNLPVQWKLWSRSHVL